MAKELWINLPVKDIHKSKDFFLQLGFSFKSEYGNTEVSAAMTIGEKDIVVMLFEETTFKDFTQHEITNTKESSEVLFSFDAESKEAVDEMSEKVLKAGGLIFGKPGGNEWLYGFGFTDPDGHRWNVLHMDMSKMPKQ